MASPKKLVLDMYRVFGSIFMAIAIAIAINSYEKFNIIRNGEVVEVSIKDIPVSCKVSNKSIKAYFNFYYEGQQYSKNIKGRYCDTLEPGQLLKLKTNRKKKTFVYLDESLTMQYVSIISLAFLGILIFLKHKK
ncbi:hypothetical protein WIW50_07765 [Flavobacteriaceae bacterium 3-367]